MENSQGLFHALLRDLAIVGALALGTLVSTAAFTESQAQSRQVDGVVELYTSQGCNSCPPADKVLGELAKDPSLLALSFPVDYWDYLGWKDTLASPDHSERQRAYAAGRGDRSIYTPQVIVNGARHVVGSNRRAIGQELRRTRPSLKVPVEMDVTPDALSIRVPAMSDGRKRSATLWLVSFSRKETVEIERGENHGRTISYYNVVRKLQPIGMWKGGAMSVEFPRAEIMKEGVNGCAVILQSDEGGRPGPIFGAAVMPQLADRES